MNWKRLVLLAVSFAACCLLAYIVFTPPSVKATENCCALPTSEQETAAEIDPNDDTIEGFTMTLSDPKGTDFANDPDNGEVGEYYYSSGLDYCWEDAKSLGYSPPASDKTTGVTTPEPDYYWHVGQVGECVVTNNECEEGSLNAVNAKSAYNQVGYDGIGYPSGTAAYYRGLKKMTLPCYYGLYQGMKYYCVFTFHWAPYLHTEYGGYNWLTSELYSTYIVDCKNQVCKTLDH